MMLRFVEEQDFTLQILTPHEFPRPRPPPLL